jgi:hypothetical protein
VNCPLTINNHLENTVRINPKKGEIFFIYPIGTITEQAILDAFIFHKIKVEEDWRDHTTQGRLHVYRVPPSFVENITEHPQWTNHKFVIYHEIGGEFREWQPEKGVRRPAGLRGKEIVKMSALRFPTKRAHRGRNV